ncbi:MAG: type II toxin-antitoxin system HigB family toxin [Pyrinomonadaceae bacterium]
MNDFAEKHPEARGPLARWYHIMKNGRFTSMSELRKAFASVDAVENLTVFNIGGNKFRLIAAIHYNRQKVYIRAILTHSEYDEERWKQ